jgi:hypothetical protein
MDFFSHIGSKKKDDLNNLPWYERERIQRQEEKQEKLDQKKGVLFARRRRTPRRGIL